MGRNLARNLARHGHTVALHNRSPERTRSLVEQHGDEGTFVPSESMADFVASLTTPRAIIIMVKAGGPTDAVIDELVPLLDEGDIIVDCGNAHYADPQTIRPSRYRVRGRRSSGRTTTPEVPDGALTVSRKLCAVRTHRDANVPCGDGTVPWAQRRSPICGAICQREYPGAVGWTPSTNAGSADAGPPAQPWASEVLPAAAGALPPGSFVLREFGTYAAGVPSSATFSHIVPGSAPPCTRTASDQVPARLAVCPWANRAQSSHEEMYGEM